MADINLLPQEEKANERYYALVHRLQIASVGVLVIVAILTVVTLFMFTTFSRTREGLVTQLADLSATVNGFKSQEELLVVVKDKTVAAEKLTTSRVDYHNFFNKLANLVPEGIFFTDFRVSAAKAVVSGKARGSDDVANLVNSLTSSKGTELVSDVSVDTLSSDETGQFSFVITVKVTGD